MFYVLHSAEHDLHFPQYHAGLRLRFSADDGRCGRIIRTTGGFRCRLEDFKLPSGLFVMRDIERKRNDTIVAS